MNKFYQIVDRAGEVEIRFYGDIAMDEGGKWSDEDTCPSDIINALKDAGDKPLSIRINSGGGSVFGGIAIYNVLKGYKGHKAVYVDGIAASIASVIMLAGDEINVPKNATIMLHEPWSIAMGTAKDFENAAESLKVCWNTILAVYEEHLADGMTIEALRDEIIDRGELWMDGAKASWYFNLNATPEVKAAACLGKSLDMWQKTPEGIPRARAEPELDEPEQLDTTDDDALNIASAFLFVEKERNQA